MGRGGRSSAPGAGRSTAVAPEASTLALVVSKCELDKTVLSNAWLRVSLALHGLPVNASSDDPFQGNDTLLAALEALGAPGGNAHLMDANGARTS